MQAERKTITKPNLGETTLNIMQGKSMPTNAHNQMKS